MEIKGKIEYWIDLADYDIETARIMLISKRFLYVGFMCHQVVEKSIKAYFWFTNGAEPPYTHNIILLSQKSGLISHLTEQHKELLNALMPLNIEARYPTDKASIQKILNESLSEQLYHQTKDFLKWIKTLLN